MSNSKMEYRDVERKKIKISLIDYKMWNYGIDLNRFN